MNVQTKLFILFAGLFVIAVVFGGIQSCRLSDIERTSGAIADQNKRLADELNVLTRDLDDTDKQLEGARVVAGNLQTEIERVRELYRGSAAYSRELAERLAEFERIIKSSNDLTEQGDRRFKELESGLRDAQAIIRSKIE
jgi:septation ring formation regulator EzrA